MEEGVEGGGIDIQKLILAVEEGDSGDIERFISNGSAAERTQ